MASDGATTNDEVTMAMHAPDLSIVGQARLRVGLAFCAVGFLIIPPAVRSRIGGILSE